MQILINTDHNIEGKEALAAHAREVVESTFSHMGEHITRVEMHLSDASSRAKIGVDDMRCVLEARLEGRPPIATTHHAKTVREAIDGATGKLARLIEHTLERLRDQKRGRTHPRARPEL